MVGDWILDYALSPHIDSLLVYYVVPW